MSRLDTIFDRIQAIILKEGQCDFISAIVFKDIVTNGNRDVPVRTKEINTCNYDLLQKLLQKICNEVNNLANEIRINENVLISVKHQKLLRTCFQLISCLGISSCLLPGLGICLEKRCASASMLPPFAFNDEQKYEMLIDCTDFFSKCYAVPVLKNIIISFHLSDYLAALIQLSFAPIKIPGIYDKFTMTQAMYDKLLHDRQKYILIYENLIANCFQPTIMKELLILQSVTNPAPPIFVRKTIAREMSRRLLTPGGLLSLIRCFIESYSIDTGFEWRKIDMICKIITVKHGNSTEDEYLNNICSQIIQILSMNNTHYLTTAVACVLRLYEKYPQSEPVKTVIQDIFNSLNYSYWISKANLPGSIILTPHEIEHKLNIFYSCLCTTKLDWPFVLVLPNLYLLFLLGIKCTKSDELHTKLRDVILKCLERLSVNETLDMLKMLLFGKENSKSGDIVVEEYEAGLLIKYVSNSIEYPKSKALLYFLDLFKASTEVTFAQKIFQVSLKIVMDLTLKRNQKSINEVLLMTEEDPVLIDSEDEQYGNILQLLSEISNLPKVITALKTNPEIVIDFIEYFVLKNYNKSNEECLSIALILLNTILSNSDKSKDLEKKFMNLIPVLKIIAKHDSDINHILCKEALSLITCEKVQHTETACEKALSDVFDVLLPVRAHGIIELTKLIDAKDPETISKKYYIFCLLQEQLKNSDSYIYLSAINGIASLGAHCTEDVLHVLCKEFLQVSTTHNDIESKNNENEIIELRMKVGDIIVRVTNRLGEMAVVHKTILLNTILCGCRDENPFIRTSAISNLAQIALVLHYRIGSIIYEVLFCIWSIIETDKAIECRRAAVMVISSLLKGLGKETLVQLKDSLLPIYRTLKSLYREPTEDSVVRLHAQIALEELNDIVNQFLFPELKMDKQIFVIDKPKEVFK